MGRGRSRKLGGDPLESGTSRPTSFATVSLKEPWGTSTGEMEVRLDQRMG
jgi:hypothetical protein